MPKRLQEKSSIDFLVAPPKISVPHSFARLQKRGKPVIQISLREAEISASILCPARAIAFAPEDTPADPAGCKGMQEGPYGTSA
jgi:hypothetical protein